MTRHAVIAAVLVWLPLPVGAQASVSLSAARRAYEDLDYDAAVAAARRALETERLGRPELIEAYRVLGYAYAVLDSTARAVDAFRELILLAPDDEPDVLAVSPKITSLYRLALSQVLVIRKVRIDSAAFVVGEGALSIRFEVSRAGLVRVRVVGGGETVVVDSQVRAGEALVRWNAGAGGVPVPPGRYEVVIDAVAGRDQFGTSVPVAATHYLLDTLPHLLALPGYAEQPEMETPRRDLTPLAVSGLYTLLGLAATAAVGDYGDPPAGMVTVSLAVVGVGTALALRRPEPRVAPAAVMYNRLVRDVLAQRNAEIAEVNNARRSRVGVVLRPIVQERP